MNARASQAPGLLLEILSSAAAHGGPVEEQGYVPLGIHLTPRPARAPAGPCLSQVKPSLLRSPQHQAPTLNACGTERGRGSQDAVVSFKNNPGKVPNEAQRARIQGKQCH